MKASLRSLHSPDVDLLPGEPVGNLDSILVQLMIGPANGPGEESFDIVVCTGAWLDRIVREKGPLLGRHYLFVDRINRESISDVIEGYLAELDEPTWPDLAQKIARIARWEFEDYRE